MPRNTWMIHSTGGGRDGSLLNGFSVQQLNDNSFTLSSPQPNSTQVATAPAGTPPLSFTQFLYDSASWTLTITSVSNSAIGGGWTNSDPDPAAQTGTWANDVGEEKDAAASAT